MAEETVQVESFCFVMGLRRRGGGMGKLGDVANYAYLKVEATRFDLTQSSANNIRQSCSMNYYLQQ
jgi:hypothetical protein